MRVELDGAPWRKLPLEPVLAAGLTTGTELSRERARALRRHLREHEAMRRASRALARRDLSERELAARLARANVPPDQRSRAVERLVRAGAVDDDRLARRRAEVLADRGSGDELIRADLAGRGVAGELIEAAIATLEPEQARAASVVEARGDGLTTARHLARKGFSEGSIEGACRSLIAEEDPPPVP